MWDRYLDKPHTEARRLHVLSAFLLGGNILGSALFRFLLAEAGPPDKRFDLLATVLGWLKSTQSFRFHVEMWRAGRRSLPFFLCWYASSRLRASAYAGVGNRLAIGGSGAYAALLLLRGFHMRALLWLHVLLSLAYFVLLPDKKFRTLFPS